MSRRRIGPRSSVDVLEDVDWQDRRVRVGIGALCVVAAVAVLVGTLDDAGGETAPPLEIGAAALAPPSATATAPGPVLAPRTTAPPAPQPFVATTAFVPTTARPTAAPTTALVYDLSLPPACSVSSAVRPGATGDAVRCVQQRLRQVTSASIADADGHFGPGTETAVRRFQQHSEIDVTGVVGASTARLLGIWADPADAADPAETS